MRAIPLVLACGLVAALLAPSRVAAGLPRPDVLIGAGGTFATTGTPEGGGASFSLSPLWPVNDRVRFGLMLFADDIGTTIARLHDPNDGSDLGAVALSHRWTFGGAWRADADLVTRGRWTAGATGSWGYWRIEDDVRGTTTAAASAIGFTLGANARRALSSGQALGFELRYHQLFSDRGSAYRRVEHYASAAIDWRWAGSSRP